jgi:hypothetical protein
MAASNSDKFKKGARKWVGQIGSGGVDDNAVTTIPLASATGLPTDTAIVAVIDRVDSSGVATPAIEESVVGVVSGNNLVTCLRGVEGTAQAHAAGAVVEILITNRGWNDIVDGILQEHNQDGTHQEIDDIDRVAEALRSGSDEIFVTGTAGTDGNLAQWNADGDLVDGPDVLDEDNMASDSATAVATQQSIKAYADTKQAALVNYRVFASRSGSTVALTANTWTKIVFNSEAYDPNNNYSTSTGVYTVPVTGVYFLSSNLTIAVNSANDNIEMKFVKNSEGTPIDYGYVLHTAPTTNSRVLVSAIALYLEANDTIEVQARNVNNSDTVTNSSSGTCLHIQRMA